MGASPSHDVTGLLLAWISGDEQALSRLMEVVYHELHRAAHQYMMNERESHTLQTTALINEVYIRLLGIRELRFQDRAHFLSMCARLMRRVLIDSARDRKSKKRGAGQIHLSLDSAPEIAAGFAPDFLAIDEALCRLAAMDERKAKVVELRFFGGLTEDEIAAALDISVDTVIRDWKFAKVWLRKELDGGKHRGS